MRTLGLLLAVAVPGAASTYAILPAGRIPGTIRAALVLPLGYASLALIWTAWAFLGILRPPVTLASWVALVAVATGVAIRRRRAGHPMLRGWLDALRSPRPMSLLLVALFLSLFFVQYSGQVDPPANRTAVRYWSDALEIADAGGFVETTLQWNRELQPAVSKAGLNTFTAGMVPIVGTDARTALQALLTLAWVSVFLASAGLGAAFGVESAAVVLPLFVVGQRFLGRGELTGDLNGYRAENMGRALAFAAGAAVILALPKLRRALADRASSEDAEAPEAGSESSGPTAALMAVGGVLIAVTVGTHLVAAAAGIALIAAAVVTVVLLRCWRRELLKPLGLFAACALMAAIPFLLPGRGDMGFGGAAGSDAYERTRAELGVSDTFDPTVYLQFADEELASAYVQPPFWEDAGGYLEDFSRVTLGWTGRELGGGAFHIWLFLIVMVTATAIALLLGRHGEGSMAVTGTVLACGLLVVGLAFLLRFDVFVLAQFGSRRLADYGGLILGLWVAAQVGVVLGRATTARDRRAGIAMLSLLIFLAVYAGRPSQWPARDVTGPEYPAHMAELMDWLDDNLSCEQRVLMDARTLGLFQAEIGRAGVIEGMGPFLRPDVLAVAIRQLRDAKDFFTDPASGEDFLADNGVGAVVVAHAAARNYSYPLSYDWTGGLSAPFLRKAADLEAGDVYLVEGLDPPSEPLPSVADAPGYLCDEDGG